MTVWVVQCIKDGKPTHICRILNNEREAKRCAAFLNKMVGEVTDAQYTSTAWAVTSEFLGENADGTPYELPRHLKVV